MDDDPGAPSAQAEHELQLLREAIAMVASRASVRVVVAGIHHGQLILDPARRLALEAGVRINTLHQEDAGCAVAVEAMRR